MPAEVLTTESSQNRQADKMSAVTQKHYGDLQQGTTTFSYAQAAKGRSPSVPSTLATGNPLSDDNERNEKRASSSETRSTMAESHKDRTKRTASEGRTPHGSELQASQDGQLAQTNDVTNVTKETIKDSAHDATQIENQDIPKPDSFPDKPTVAGQSQLIVSTPSSPEYGTTSTSTLPKEDDMFSTANASSDSTSDKQSQTSQNGNKTGEKVDVGKGQNVASSWDEEMPAPTPTLKEAALPPINVWQMRSQNQAKSKSSTTIQPSKPVNLANGLGNSNGSSKGNESNLEPKKQDSRKKSKGLPGLTEDRSALGSGKDGSKSTDVTEKGGHGLVAPPPPPGDAISWPTPDSAAGDGKKRNQDRVDKAEKDASQAPKPHGKEKWVPVPYVPTAVFTTPLPSARRGGRGAARGGREGDTRGRNTATIGNGPEKPTVAGAANGQTPSISGHDRGRATLGSTPANPSTSKSKRASSAGPTTPREQRKPGDAASLEKRKGSDAATSKAVATTTNTVNASRRPSASATNKDSQTARSSGYGQGMESSWSSTVIENFTDGDKKLQHGASDVNGTSKGGIERQSEGSFRSSDSVRDFQGSIPTRERGEPRVDRGRGGFRGRGGGSHAFFTANMPNGHGFSNGYASQYQPGPTSPSKSHSNHDRLSSQTQSSPFYSTHHQPRHYRSNSRSQSIPHSNQYGRFSNGHHGGPPHLANLQTDIANEYGYLPAHQGAMSAMPFSSFGEQTSVFGMVNLQMNYYFSVENLCKDMYLRSHMDSQGFVFLDLLAQFNRIKQLTNDMELIRFACHHSQTIEYVNVDGVDRVRAREGWQQWVRRMEERDPSAQNDGPSLQSLSQYSQPLNYVPTPEDHQIVSPRSMAAGNTIDGAHYQPLNGVAPSFGRGSNANESHGLDGSVTKTPLSAAVSEFSPSARSTNPRNFSTPDHHAQGTSVFTDSQVENLRILVRRPVNTAASMPPPFHSASSRTFSNGSIDGRSINDELAKFAERQTQPMPNGDASER